MKTFRLRIPSGDAGADVTARVLRTLIEQGKRDSSIRETATTILKTSDVAPHDQWGEVRALHGWVQKNVRYVRDPYQVEYVQTPNVMLSTMVGDCDDYTVLLGSLLESVGYPVDIKVVAKKGRRLLHHVYPVVTLDGIEVGLDAAMPVPFGSQSTELRKTRVYRSELDPMIREDVYAGLGISPSVPIFKPKVPPKTPISPSVIIRPPETPSLPAGIEKERVVTGGCTGVLWPDIVMQPTQRITDRCIRERISWGKIKAAPGCRLEVTPVREYGVDSVVCIPIALDVVPALPPDADIPPHLLPPGEPISPEVEVRCYWPPGRATQVLQAGEQIVGHCVKKFADIGKYQAAEGCKLIYQGPRDPIHSTIAGTLTCVPVGYDEPPEDFEPPPGGHIPPDRPEERPFIPGAPPPTVITVPSGAPVVKEAGFPTWAIIAIAGAVLLPMLLKGK